MIQNYKVITLCGSTRFKDQFIEAQKRLTLEGCIVIIDDMHLRKIDMADEIFVINVGGYIGESTRRETGKKVNYLEPVNP